jgi:hypothetical protein
VPAFPNDEWDDPDWRGFLIEIQQWNAAAGRILENFCDRSHVPWVPSGRERNEFVVTLPFTAHLRQVLGSKGETTIVSMTAAPLGPKLSNVYMWSTRNHHLEPTRDHTLREFALQVMAEDRLIVESQRPEMIPLDLRDEMHLKVPDAFSIVYRRLLDEFGPEETFLRA